MDRETRVIPLFLLNVAWKVNFCHHFCILTSLSQNLRWPPSARFSFCCCQCFIHFWAMWHSNVCHSAFPAKFIWESHFKRYLFILYGDFIDISIRPPRKRVEIKLSKLIVVSKVESLWISVLCTVTNVLFALGAWHEISVSWSIYYFWTTTRMRSPAVLLLCAMIWFHQCKTCLSLWFTSFISQVASCDCLNKHVVLLPSDEQTPSVLGYSNVANESHSYLFVLFI